MFVSRTRLAIGVLGILATAPAFTSSVVPNDPRVRYIGRFDTLDPDGPKCSWPASTVEISFRGTFIKVNLRETGQDQLQVVVDGVPTQILKLTKGEGTYVAAMGLRLGDHVVQLFKRTEAFVGTVQYLGFDVDGRLRDPVRPRHVIEIIGDSISCGYGIEAKSRDEHFRADTENAYETYGAIAARELGADLIDISCSGRKMWPDSTIPELYDLSIPDDKTTVWDQRQQTPDIILINLGTNDFGRVIPDERKWSGAYADFIKRLRERAPHARIYCAIGPMISNTWPPEVKALSSLQRYLTDVVGLRAAVGDNNLRILEFGTHDEARDVMGADSHPSLKTHQRMAQDLVSAIRQELSWNPINRVWTGN